MKPYVTQETLAAHTEKWLAKIAHVNRKRWDLRNEKSALLVVDMQRYFLDSKADHFSCGGQAILPNVIRLIESFRKANRPVIFTRHAHDAELLEDDVMNAWWGEVIVDGTPEAEIVNELSPKPNELIIDKNRYSAFYKTELDKHLETLGIQDIVIAGIKTNLCCESTARDAYYRSYRTFIPADGTGTGSDEMHVASLLNLAYGFSSVVTTDEILSQFLLSDNILFH